MEAQQNCGFFAKKRNNENDELQRLTAATTAIAAALLHGIFFAANLLCVHPEFEAARDP